MAFSKAFIDAVKRVYPEDKNIQEMAINNNPWLGRYLDDMSQGDIKIDDILNASSLELLQRKARELQTRKQLYTQWYEERTS